MFQLYDQTRRRISLALFFLFCIVPTALVIALCVERRLPGYARREADLLGRQLGAKVSLDRVLHPRPGKAVYEGLRLDDAETGRTILTCRHLQVAAGDGSPPVVITAAGLEVRPEQWEQGWALLDRILSCRAGWSALDVELRADQAILCGAGEPRGLDQLQVRIQIVPAGSQAELSFRLAGVAMPEPARIRIVRNRQTDPPETGFEWNTGTAAIPAAVLPTALGFAELLGTRSWIRGAGWANRTAEGWLGIASGQLLQVDLDQLVTNRFPHILSGQAQITIHDLRFHQSRIQQCQAGITAESGMVSRSLLDSAVASLGLSGPKQPAPPQSLVPYNRLALEFLLDSQGLKLLGQCPPGGSGTVLAGSHGPVLAGATGSQPWPIAALLQVLAPAGVARIPVAPQTEALLRRLPFPTLAVSPTSDTIASPATGDRSGHVQR